MCPDAKDADNVFFTKHDSGQLTGQFTAFESIAGIRHLFTTAIGPFGNLGSNLPNWRQTRLQLGQMVNANSTAYPQQVHGCRVVTAQKCLDQTQQADAVVTNRENIALLCISADCPVILLADTQSAAIAAIHSGWHGTAANIVSSAIDTLESLYAAKSENIVAGICPCACQCCYEVDNKVVDVFAETTDIKTLNDCLKKSAKNDGKFMLNLPGIISSQLTGSGVSVHNIHSSAICTICDERFHSYRRCGPEAGRCGAIISRQAAHG